MQDVPSFLQEVLTVRGQIAYATKDLRAKLGMPKKVADVDDVTLANMDLFVPLSEFSERCQTMHAVHVLESPQDNVKCDAVTALTLRVPATDIMRMPSFQKFSIQYEKNKNDTIYMRHVL